MKRKKDTYTVESGRNIYKNGERFIYIGVCQGVYDYADVDTLTHDICRLLTLVLACDLAIIGYYADYLN